MHPIIHIPDGYWTGNETWKPIRLMYYNASLGNQGSWQIKNATREDGSLIYYHLVDKLTILYDEYYGQFSMWVSIPSNPEGNTLKFSKTVKYVCTGKKWYEFRAVLEIKNATMDNYLICGKPIDNFAKPSFQVVGVQYDYGLIGYKWKGSNMYEVERDMLWLAKYTATKTGILTGIRIYVKSLNGYCDIKIALYNSTFVRPFSHWTS